MALVQGKREEREKEGGKKKALPPPPGNKAGGKGISSYPPPSQHVPPPTESRETWSMVVGRKRGSGGENPRKGRGTGLPAGGSGAPPAGQPSMGGKKVVARKLPTMAAITITAKEGGYGDIIRTARRAIGEDALKEIGIQELRTRKSMTGAYILEIPGSTREERKVKAGTLADKLEAVFGGNEGIRISRLLKMIQIRIRDLDESIEQEDIVQALIGIGEGSLQDIKGNRTATSPNGMGAVVVQCPLSVANKVVGLGKVKVGWAACRVSMMEVRPLQYFRCLELGHVQQRCTGAADRNTCCYRCGVEGHIAANCRASS